MRTVEQIGKPRKLTNGAYLPDVAEVCSLRSQIRYDAP